MKALAIGFWVLAWCFAGLIVTSFFAARNGKRGTAWAELATGVAGAAGLAVVGAVVW